jgi:hypothetical protein
MLAAPGADGAAVGAAADPWRVARGIKGGAWAELQLARPGDTAERKDFERWRDDSWFVSLEAMTALHDPFARALPGFDLFLPRLYVPDALSTLATELDALAARSTGPAAVTSRELASVAREASAKHQSLWVLGL